MTRITKLELTQINSRLATENEQLRFEVTRLYVQLQAERSSPRVAQLEAERSSPRVAQYSKPQWQIDRLAAMEAARQLAITSHKLVLVA